MKNLFLSYYKNSKGIVIIPLVIITALTVGASAVLINNSTKTLNSEISKIKVGDYVDYDPTIADLDGTYVSEDKLTYTSPIGSIPYGDNTSENNDINPLLDESLFNTSSNTMTNTTKKSSSSSKTNSTNEQVSTEPEISYTDGEVITHGNGIANQKFTAKPLSDLKWRVLSVSNDQIELIADSVVKTDSDDNFIIKGGIGYLYAEQELNEICKIYGYGYGADTSMEVNYSYGGPYDGEMVDTITNTGARSITMDDINNLAGFTESDLKSFNSDYNEDIELSTDVYYPSLYGTSSKYMGESLRKERKFKNTYYTFNKTIIEDPLKQDLIFNGNYWIATRGISTDTKSSTIGALVYLTNSDDLNGGSICYGNSSHLNDYTANFLGVRPVVTIKTNVIDFSNESTDGTKENAWQLK